MKIFINSLSEKRQDSYLPEWTTPTEMLTTGVDTTAVSASWFYAYKSSDWPEITDVTKQYFFIWSTDHQDPGTFWGEGNNLDLTDFVEKGKCFSQNNSQESPKLFRIGSEIFLGYHPKTTPQQTDFLVTTGGSLTLANTNGSWTWIDNPLGLLADENHTGYFIFNTVENKLYGTTYQYQGIHNATPSPVDWSNTRDRYSYSNDGYNWVRELRYDVNRRYVDNNKIHNERGSHFTRRGVNYHFARADAEGETDTKLVALTKYDSDFRNPELVKYISDFEVSDFGLYIEDDTVHFYLCHPRSSTPTKIYYSTLDISQL